MEQPCSNMRTQCPALTAPTNGARTPPTGSNSYQDQINFNCNTGYVLNGATSATCQADGTWSNPVPTCTPRPCPGLTAPINGALNPPAGPYNYPNQVTVTCNSGYGLSGVSPLTCQADGTWSNPVGTCEPDQCSTLAAPTNGARTPPTGSNSFQDRVSFTCNSGYVLNGATSVTCQVGGTWSDPVPTCTPRACPTLTAPTNGALSPNGPYAYPNQVTVTCNSGYQLNGVSPVTCQADGTWSNPVGTCTPRPCPALTTPTNGALSPTGPYSYPNQVTVSCNSGYNLNGDSPLTCQADGTWSNPVPTCESDQCPTLAAPTNGARMPPTGSNSFQQTVSFACNSGYVLNGATTVTCRAGGTWSDPIPTCTPRPCPALTTPTNGARNPSGPYAYQDMVTFTCDTGYGLNGVSPVTCQADGTWSNPAPTCEPGQCPTLAAPTNGARTPPTGSNTFQDRVSFTCNSGYTLNGANTVTCQADGTWSDQVPTCTPRPCPGLTTPTNGALSPPGPYSYPDQVTVTCNSGYQLTGVSPLACQADGTWSNPVPTCERKITFD
ncbi:P-selectin-like [Branchiostoma floridae x Branchiostoma japonicum]